MNRLSLALAGVLALAGALLLGSSPVSAQNCSGTPSGNTICASPSGGGSGFPGFRAMVGADVSTHIITNDKLAQAAPGSVKCQPSSSNPADYQDCPGVGTGFAELKPYPGQASGAANPWMATDPFGNAISCASTATQCLQEFVTAAKNSGWSWRVLGAATITLNNPIAFPTCSAKTEYIDVGVSLSFATQGATTLATVDSHENCYSKFLGQMVQNSADTGVVLSLKPTIADGFGNTIFAASYFELPTSITPASGGSGVQCDPTTGGFVGNTFFINDVNGGATGIKCLNPGTAFIAVEQNKFKIGYIHGQTTRVGQILTGTTNQGNVRYNTWEFGRIDPGSGATVGWDTWESYATYTNLAIDNETANATTGLKVESGATGNLFQGGVVQATTPLSDSGSCNSYKSVRNLRDIITFSGETSGCISTQGAAAAGTYNDNKPTTAGTAGQVLASGGGGSASQTWMVPARMRYCITGVNFNSANTDNAIALSPLPVTRWTIGATRISNASHTLTTATAGVFTSTGGGGVAISADQALTVSATTPGSANSVQGLTSAVGTTMFNDTTLQFRVGTAEGAAATADVCVEIIPLT